MDLQNLTGGIFMGIGATFLVDMWNLFLKRAFGISSLSYCMLGRWMLHMPEGKFTHTKIAAAAEKPFECAVGWIAHYSIGASLALAFIIITSDNWLVQPALLPALLYGIATVAFPLFVLQPALGLGMASGKTANPLQARVKSLMTHTVFGVGLWVSALGLSALNGFLC
jgi:hypothetical protein